MMPRSLLYNGKILLSNFTSYRNFSSLFETNKASNSFKLLTKLSKRTSTTSTVCWKCGVERKNLSKLFCEECTFIQNPHETKNFFKVMDIEEKFNIDSKVLTQKYRQMQTLLHPDKFSNKTQEEKAISADFSALVNKAYNNLQKPLERAEHLLHLKGHQITENTTVSDPEFLMEMMTLNEELESTKNEKELRAIDFKNKKKIEEIVAAINTMFNKNHIEKAKEEIAKLKYYISLSNRISAIMRDSGIVD